MSEQDEPIDRDESLDQGELFDDDLIDRIGNFLPLKSRAGFYRELRYCRSVLGPHHGETARTNGAGAGTV
jgi:hypothetical protein